MTIQPAPPHLPAARVPAAAALVAGIGTQLVDDLAFLVLPPLGLLGPLAGIFAILLTAAGARYVTRNASGASIARTGLAVGVVSAAVGVLIGGFGLVAIVLAGLTVLAGVVGAVVGRGVTAGRS
ncbi:MAG: hypothetical protein L0H84_15220 [Pseudonocardia sp.]|nr:hypothetical protein [Pseudonocardia sp.]